MGQEVNSNVHFGHPKSLVFCAVGLCVLAQSCATLCDPGDGSPPGSSVHGILQARMLEWIAISSSRGSPNSGIKLEPLAFPALAGMFFTTRATWEALIIYGYAHP